MPTGSSIDPNAYYLTPIVKGNPHFLIKERQGKNFVEIQQDEWVEGYIKNITIGTYEYEGATLPKFVVFLIDTERTYIISFTYTIPSRNIINTLLSIEKPGLIRFVLGIDKNDYPTSFVSNNGEFAGWKYKYGEFENYINKSKGSRRSVRNNYDKLDEFFEQELKEWIEEKRMYFVDVAPQFDIKTSSPPASASEEQQTETQSQEESPIPEFDIKTSSPPASASEEQQTETQSQEESPIPDEEQESQVYSPDPDDKTDDLPF